MSRTYDARKIALDDATAALTADGSFRAVDVHNDDLDPKTGTGRVHRPTSPHTSPGGFGMYICLVGGPNNSETCVKISNTDPVQYSVTSADPAELDRVKAILGVPASVAPVFELER